ncbi:MAG: virulence RhuM family protein [Rhodospirillales bacterium]|nr:virulence RhuM family protein [Rhodospirillales bacterium]MCB9997073.1 virulence RhuM family protein [Rhodospirillales bacterium]
MGDRGEIILYQTDDGLATIHLRAFDHTVWLTQAEIAELFQKDKRTVSEHLQNIFAEGELDEHSVVRNFRTTASDGKAYDTNHYNLDAILAVGYRVKSQRGTQFRKWATTALREYLVKGFVINDEWMKDPGGWDYFDELLERIRDIRTSEKRFYQQVKDVYATAIDYDLKSDAAQLFFKTVQNKMLFSVTKRTAAELIIERADSGQPNMGLKSWRGSVVRKGDVATAKNYLAAEEISELNRIVTMYLDYAEDMARRRKEMTMKDWEERLDAFLVFNERDVLSNAGSVSAEQAKQVAYERYKAFDMTRKEIELLEAETEYIEDLRAIEEEAKVLQKKIRKDTADGG